MFFVSFNVNLIDKKIETSGIEYFEISFKIGIISNLLVLCEIYKMCFDNIYSFSPALPNPSSFPYSRNFVLILLILQDQSVLPKYSCLCVFYWRLSESPETTLLEKTVPHFSLHLPISYSSTAWNRLYTKFVIFCNRQDWEEGGLLSFLLLLCHMH